MLTRRQLMRNGLVVSAVPLIGRNTDIALPAHAKRGDICTRLGVHPTVLDSVMDRFSALLPDPCTLLSHSRHDGDSGWFQASAAGLAPGFEGRWRLSRPHSTEAMQSLDEVVGLGCSALAGRLPGGAALRHRVGLQMGGLHACMFEGHGTRICLLARTPFEPRATTLFLT